MKHQHQIKTPPSGPYALVKYDAACLAIKAASEIDEVQDFISKAAAMREYGRQVKNIELQNRAALIRIRAQYRLGELLKETPRNDGYHRDTSEASRSPKTLKEMGISLKQSSVCQHLATSPEEKINKALAAIATTAREITTAAVLRTVQPKTRKTKEKAKNCTITAKNIEDTRCLSAASHRLHYCQEKVQLLVSLKKDSVVGTRATKVLKIYLQMFREFSKFCQDGVSYMERNQ